MKLYEYSIHTWASAAALLATKTRIIRQNKIMLGDVGVYSSYFNVLHVIQLGK